MEMVMNGRANLSVTSLVVLLSWNAAVMSNSHTDWQLKRLYSPTAQELELERNKVFIYDGLYAYQVDKAMDNQFDRIDSMMFVRVKVVEDGEEQQLKDGCD